MSNLICYSLDQNSIRYLEIIKYNINFISFFIPKWKIRFYLKSDNRIKNELSNFKNCELFFFDYGSINFSKFLAISEKSKVERFLVRNYKYYFNILEINMIKKWIDSNKLFHLISTNDKLLQYDLIGINNLELDRQKISIHFNFKRNYEGICDYFCETFIKPILKDNYLSHNKDRFIEYNPPPNLDQFQYAVKDITYLGEEVDEYGSLSDKTLIPIESISIMGTKEVLDELILLLESINYLYDRIYIEFLCDFNVKNFFEDKYMNDTNFLKNIRSYITFYPTNFEHKSNTEQRDLPKWMKFMFKKMDIMRFALNKHKNTVYLDSDMILFQKLPLVPKNKDVGLCHHYINTTDVESFGAFNAGMIYISNKNFINWFLEQQGTNKCRYYEQTILEYTHNKFKTFLFKPQVNFGYWRFTQSVHQKWVYQNFKIKDGLITYQNRNLQSIHTHLLGKHPNIAGFNKVIIDLILKSNSYVKDILLKYNILKLPKIPVFIVHYGNQEYLSQVINQSNNFENRTYLIGDPSNKNFTKNHLNITTDDKLENKFQSVYKHFSTNNEPFERICISRWFKILYYVDKLKIDNFCVIDSDVLLYSDVSVFLYKNIYNHEYWRKNGLMHLVSKNKNVSCAQSFWNINTLRNLCRFIIEFYNENNVIKMESWFENYKKENIGGICDMTLIYYFIAKKKIFSELQPKSNLIQKSLCQIFNNNLTFDNSFTENLNNYKMKYSITENKKTPIKDIIFIKNIPFCYNLEIKKYIRFNNLHFHASKELIKIYFKKTKVFKKKKIILPEYFEKDNLYYHKNDTFRELVKLWNEMGLCDVQFKKTKHVWINKIGDILLYDRPTLQWIEKDLNYNLGLFGNPVCPNNKKNNKQWIFWGRRPQLLEFYKQKKSFKLENKDIGSIFLGKIETNQQLNNRKNNWANYIERFECPVTSSKEYKYTQDEYLQLLSRSQFGLCLPGFGNKCNREIELFALSVVPIFTPGVCRKYCFKLKENENYLLAKKPEDIPLLIKDCDRNKWQNIVNNNTYIYEKYLSIIGAFNTTMNLINNRVPKLSVVLFSKNDDYIPDKIDRVSICFTYLLESFDEIIYVDWGSEECSLLHIPEINKIVKNSKKVKHIIVKPSEISQMLPNNVPKICHVLARNIGLRRASGDYILSTNIDIIVPSKKNILNLLQYDNKDTMYVVSRKDIDSEFTKAIFNKSSNYLFDILDDYCKRINRKVDKDPINVFTKYAKSQVEGILLESHLKYSKISNCGDFQFASKEVWNKIKGFEEGMINSAWGTDSSIQAKVINNNFKLKILTTPNVYHISHDSRSHGNTPVTNDMYKYFTNIKYSFNNKDWGFKNYQFNTEIL
jgi:hypothetical protein